jgi:hypothetical protein
MNKSTRIRELAKEGIPVAEITRRLKEEYPEAPPAYQMVYQVVKKMDKGLPRLLSEVEANNQPAKPSGVAKRGQLLIDFKLGDFRCTFGNREGWIVTNSMGTVVLHHKKMKHDEVTEWVENRIRQEALLLLDPKERGRSRGEALSSEGGESHEAIPPEIPSGDEAEGALSAVSLESLARIDIPDAHAKGRKRDPAIIKAAKAKAKEAVSG